MSVLLHISDTHFGTEQPLVAEALVALATQQGPEIVVLSGDITQRARPAQFHAAKTFVDRLGSPVLAIPGNHDIPLFDLWTRVTRPYVNYAAVFGADLGPVHSSSDFLVLGVNTTRVWRHKNGEVSAAQIDHVARRLSRASPEQLRVVVVHQPAAVTEARDQPDLLRGHTAALQAWSSAGADLVLGGHIHKPYTLAQQGITRRMWVVQAGTALSTRTLPGVPNSVHILRWGKVSIASSADAQTEIEVPACYQIEQWDYARQDQAFVRTAVTNVQPERG
jgi:3',5'-cyclic AMP phosphodiesterase CpdA